LKIRITNRERYKHLSNTDKNKLRKMKVEEEIYEEVSTVDEINVLC